MKRSQLTLSSGAITGTTETAVATIPAPVLNDNPLTNAVIVDGIWQISLGTTQTSAVLRVRRNAVNGTVVGPSGGFTTGTLAANATTGLIAFQVADLAPAPPPATYVLTVQQAGGAGNGSVVYLVATATAG